MSSDKPNGGLPNPCKKNYFYYRYEYDCVNYNILGSEYTQHDEKCRAIFEGFLCITDYIELYTGVRCNRYIERFRGYIRRNFSVDIDQCDFKDPTHDTTTVQRTRSTSPTWPTRTRKPTYSPTRKPTTTNRTTKKPKTRHPATKESSTHRTTIPDTSRVTTTSGVDGNNLPSISDSQEVDPAIIISCTVGGAIVIALLTLFLWKRKYPNTCKSNTENEEMRQRDNIMEQHRRKQGLHDLHMSQTYEVPNVPYQSKDHMTSSQHRSAFIQPAGPYNVPGTTEQQQPFKTGVTANNQEDVQNPHYENVQYNNRNGTPEQQYDEPITEDIYLEISDAEVGHGEYEQLRSPCDKTNDLPEYLEPIQSSQLSSEQYLTLEYTGNENRMSNSRNENVYTGLTDVAYVADNSNSRYQRNRKF